MAYQRYKKFFTKFYIIQATYRVYLYESLLFLQVWCEGDGRFAVIMTSHNCCLQVLYKFQHMKELPTYENRIIKMRQKVHLIDRYIQ